MNPATASRWGQSTPPEPIYSPRSTFRTSIEETLNFVNLIAFQRVFSSSMGIELEGAGGVRLTVSGCGDVDYDS